MNFVNLFLENASRYRFKTNRFFKDIKNRLSTNRFRGKILKLSQDFQVRLVAAFNTISISLKKCLIIYISGHEIAFIEIE